MNIQIRTEELSELQVALEKRYEEAVNLLRQNGFNAEYRACVVATPSDNPGYISIRGNKP